ncbi:MAG: DUF4082 domain-containing protein [Terrimicrobiaceae bacterium]
MNKNPLFSAKPAFGTGSRNLQITRLSMFWAAIGSLLFAALSPCLAVQSCTLAWDASSGATGYRLRYGTTSENLGQPIDVGNTTTRTVSNLNDATTYYFTVTAYNAAGESQPSNQVSYRTPGPTGSGYVLTVYRGTGDGTYAAGTSVPVSANAPNAGERFNVWTGDTEILPSQDLDNASTTALMPSMNVTITATYTAASVSIWRNTDVPQNADSGDDRSVELGVKFRSDVAGKITGIRFYKAPANTGRHVGNLWTSSGTLLATATFTGETGSGWQQVNFATPVPITANTVYVASYHCDAGHYSADLNYFSSTSGEDNPPLHALPSTSSNGNGVYAYGVNGNFPNQSWNSCNYWVDVVFQQ